MMLIMQRPSLTFLLVVPFPNDGPPSKPSFLINKTKEVAKLLFRTIKTEVKMSRPQLCSNESVIFSDGDSSVFCHLIMTVVLYLYSGPSFTVIGEQFDQSNVCWRRPDASVQPRFTKPDTKLYSTKVFFFEFDVILDLACITRSPFSRAVSSNIVKRIRCSFVEELLVILLLFWFWPS